MGLVVAKLLRSSSPTTSRCDQHLFAEMNPVDQNGHQVQFFELSLTQLLQLRSAGGHESIQKDSKSK
ncbi:MAG TPA: hypothetical protein VFP96_02145 [Candidatus Acidoferrum sp.]|nr:hypothetical protein [Candidatus Acidoferrum sp.]